MRPNSSSFTVKHGQVHIRVHQRASGAWFFKRKINGVWKPYESVDRKKVEEEAKLTAKLASSERANVLGLNQADVAEFLKWREEKDRSVSVRAAYSDYREAKGKNTLSVRYGRSIEGLGKILDPLGSENIREISASDIDRLITSLGDAGPRRKNNVRSDLVTFFRWCRKRGILPDRTTAPELTDKLSTPAPSKEIFSADEIKRLLRLVSPDWRPWLAIAAFSGIRTEEIQRLTWDDVLLDRGVIDVRAENAKTKTRRLVPIQPNLAAWLGLHSDRSGLVAPSRIDNYIRTLTSSETFKAAKLEWRTNGLRHSYGSNRMAVIQNAPQLAEEMGNSIPMIRKHYVEALLPKDGAEWFSIFPSILDD